MINVVDKALFPKKIHTWLMNKFNPWEPGFKVFIQRCLEAGLVKHYEDLTVDKARSDFYKSDEKKNVIEERPKISPMTLEDLQVMCLTKYREFYPQEYFLLLLGLFSGSLLPVGNHESDCSDCFHH